MHRSDIHGPVTAKLYRLEQQRLRELQFLAQPTWGVTVAEASKTIQWMLAGQPYVAPALLDLNIVKR